MTMIPTQVAHDDMGMSPKGPSFQDLQGTFKGLSGEQNKNLWFNAKIVF